jgi:hypothetical protein
VVTCVALHVWNFANANQAKVLSKWSVSIVLLARTQVGSVKAQLRLKLLPLGASLPSVEARELDVGVASSIPGVPASFSLVASLPQINSTSRDSSSKRNLKF